MRVRAPLARVFLHSLLSILFAQAPPQTTTPNSEPLRMHLKQEELCCFDMHFVKPVYPREARLAHIEGVVKLILVIAENGSVADLQAVSGDPLLLDSAMRAVRQWHVSTVGGVAGRSMETEVALSFTFKIEKPPKPAYLHLSNGEVIRVDRVREFTDGIEYTVGRRTRHISADSVTDINTCARISLHLLPREGDCIPSGGPSFEIRAIPLLPVGKTDHSDHPALP
jgi:TonB family protein